MLCRLPLLAHGGAQHSALMFWADQMETSRLWHLSRGRTLWVLVVWATGQCRTHFRGWSAVAARGVAVRAAAAPRHIASDRVEPRHRQGPPAVHGPRCSRPNRYSKHVHTCTPDSKPPLHAEGHSDICSSRHTAQRTAHSSCPRFTACAACPPRRLGLSPVCSSGQCHVAHKHVRTYGRPAPSQNQRC